MVQDESLNVSDLFDDTDDVQVPEKLLIKPFQVASGCCEKHKQSQHSRRAVLTALLQM